MARPSRTMSSAIDLPITPMLDMTFQLLAFFILSFNPMSAVEGQLQFTLPVSPGGRLEPVELPPEPPTTEPGKLTAPLTVVVKTVRDGVNDGNISALILQTLEGELAVPDLEALRAALQSKREESAGQLKIAAETRLKYACLIDVMDTCLKSGFQNVGFAAPPDLGVH